MRRITRYITNSDGQRAVKGLKGRIKMTSEYQTCRIRLNGIAYRLLIPAIGTAAIVETADGQRTIGTIRCGDVVTGKTLVSRVKALVAAGK